MIFNQATSITISPAVQHLILLRLRIKNTLRPTITMVSPLPPSQKPLPTTALPTASRALEVVLSMVVPPSPLSPSLTALRALEVVLSMVVPPSLPLLSLIASRALDMMLSITQVSTMINPIGRMICCISVIV